MNFKNILPNPNLNNDYYTKIIENRSSISFLKAVRITNVQTNDLNFLSHKLDQYDEILQQTLSKSTIQTYYDWLKIAFELTVFCCLIYLTIKLLRCCRRFRRNRQGKMTPAIHNNLQERREKVTECCIVKIFTRCLSSSSDTINEDIELNTTGYESTTNTSTPSSGQRIRLQVE